MRARAFLLLVALTGCGLVSGLDVLHVGDASSGDDATASDATSEGAPDDGGIAADAAVSDGSGIACGKIHCAPTLTCCASPANGANEFAYTCAGSCEGGVVLHCDDRSDCTNGIGEMCCFSSSVAQCVLAPPQGCASLCVSSSQCAGGTQCVPFDAGYGLSLSRCQ